MSYHTWHTYGYGIRTDDIKVKSVEALQALLSLAPLTQQDFKEWFEINKIETPTLEDYYEYEETDGCHLAAILRMVIMETEGVEFTACNDFNDRDYLLFEPLYPWGLTDTDRAMTKERIEEIFQKHLSIITNNVPMCDYQEAENGG